MARNRSSSVGRAVTRRRFIEGMLGAAGGLVIAASCAPKPAEAPTSAPASLPSGGASQAPKFAGAKLSVLKNSDFVPTYDPFFKGQVAAFAQETGAQVTVDTIAEGQLPEKIAAAIEAGSGPDIIMANHNWAHVYQDGLVDVSDVVEEVKKLTGEFYPQIEAYNNVDGKYLSVPHHFLSNAIHYRKSWFAEIGVNEIPDTYTYDDFFAWGEKLKAKGHPLGYCLGHSPNDPNVWTYPLLWAYGGREVDEQGKVAINSPETIAALKAVQDAWPKAFLEDGLAWDDSGNNTAFLAGQISACTNGTSIWWVSQGLRPQDQKKDWADDVGFALYPTGPNGQFSMGVPWNWGILKYSGNVDLAKEFIKWTMRPEVWMPGFEIAYSFHNGVGPKQNDNELWDEFPPVAQMVKDAPESAQPIGYAGPANRNAGLALQKYIVVDMFAKAAQGEDPQAIVAWAENELEAIYG